MEYTLSHFGERKVVKLKGPINEDSGVLFQEILDNLKEQDSIVEFNFHDVTTINSLGVRCWVSFLRIAEVNRKVFFSECISDVIMQINMIPSFLGKAAIESFYVNYVCERCQKEENILIETKNLAHKTIPTTPHCDKDSCAMQTEELEEEYFAFLLR